MWTGLYKFFLQVLKHPPLLLPPASKVSSVCLSCSKLFYPLTLYLASTAAYLVPLELASFNVSAYAHCSDPHPCSHRQEPFGPHPVQCPVLLLILWGMEIVYDHADILFDLNSK